MNEENLFKVNPIPQLMQFDDKRIKKLQERFKGNLFKGHRRQVIVGQSGSGKSSYVYTWFKKFMKKYYDQIYIISGTKSSDDAWKKIKTHDNEEPTMIHEYDQTELEELINEIEKEQDIRKEENEEPMRVAIVFDDMATDDRVMNNHRNTMLDKLFVQGRHWNIDVYVISQMYNRSLSKNVRCVNPTQVIIFNLPKNNLRQVSEEHCPAGAEEKVFLEFMMEHFSEPYKYLIIDYTKPPRERVRTAINKSVDIVELSN